MFQIVVQKAVNGYVVSCDGCGPLNGLSLFLDNEKVAMMAFVREAAEHATNVGEPG